MTNKYEKISEAYNFFRKSEENGSFFQLEDIADATGWAKSTIEAYKSKKWPGFLHKSEEGYFCGGIGSVSLSNFIDIHRQSVKKKIGERDIEWMNYLEKSREFALLAIQVFNNPIINFRLYGFVVNMIIAYTALFHAIFSRKNEIFWYEKNGKPVVSNNEIKYWELSKCVDKYYLGNNNGIVANINLFIGLRNKIEHKNLPNLDLLITGYAQSFVRNYEKLLVDEFDLSSTLTPNLAIAIQLSYFSEEYKQTIKSIGSSNYLPIKEYLDIFCARLPPDIAESEDFCFRVFVIPKIGNHPTSSDRSIEFVKFDANDPDDIERSTKIIGLIKEKKILVSNPWKLLASIVVKRVESRTQKKFSIFLHTNAWKLYQIRRSGNTAEGCNLKYCSYNEPFQRYLYTEEWVDFLCEKVTIEDEYTRILKFKYQKE